MKSDSKDSYGQKITELRVPCLTWVTGTPPWNQAWGRGSSARSWWLDLYAWGPVGLSPNEQHGFAFLWAHHLQAGSCKSDARHQRWGPWRFDPGLPKLALGTWNAIPLARKDFKLVCKIESSEYQALESLAGVPEGASSGVFFILLGDFSAHIASDVIRKWKDYFLDLLNPTGLSSMKETESVDFGVGLSITVAEVTETTHICNIVWTLGTVPLDWQTGVVVPFFRKGDQSMCSNFYLCFADLEKKALDHVPWGTLGDVLQLSLERFAAEFEAAGKRISASKSETLVFSLKRVNEWNKNDERLLAAVEHGEADKVVSLLSKKGANAVKLDSEGKSALHVAAARGQTDCLAVILSHGADLSVTDTAGFTPLHLAAKNNHVECCRKLIQSKCPVEAVDSSGKTALHHAAVGGNVQIVQLLCEVKSPINLKDADGLTPLMLSTKHSHSEVCSTLLDCGAEVNISDNTGRTALMLAAESISVSEVEVLVQRGADLSLVDSEGHDVVHYAMLSGSSEAKSALLAALNRHQLLDPRSSKSPQHDQVAKLSDERITTPKKRKAPPPPISPLQSSGPSSPSVVTSTSTPASTEGETPKRFNYKEDDFTGSTLKEEVEKLHEERNMLLETIDDLKQTVETGAVPELNTKVEQTTSAALVSALQSKITSLTLENQELANKLRKHPSQQENELKECSRPNSMASNASFHSTQDDLESASHVPPTTQKEGGDHPVAVPAKLQEDESEGSRNKIGVLKQALENIQIKLLETKKENQLLQAQLKPEQGRGRDEGGSGRETRREEELMESLAELQAKLTDTQERYHQALEEVEDLKVQVGRGEGELTEKQEVQKRLLSTLEQEVKQLKSQLVQLKSERDDAAQRIIQLEEMLKRMEEDRGAEKEKEQMMAQIEEVYMEAQEEIRILQEALKGTVPVEAAAKDFEEMKAELNEVIAGQQHRLLELSHSYSETKSQLSATQNQLAEARAGGFAESSSSSETQAEGLKSRVEELQALLAETERKLLAAQEDIQRLKQEAEVQAQSSVTLTDHTQVVSSLGNAIKELESELEAVRRQLHQKTMLVETLQQSLTSEKDVTPDDSVSHLEHENMREQMEHEVNHLTQLLQGALRKQDEMALEAADAWQKARDNRAEREALQELLVTREKESQMLTSKLAESQDAVCQLKQLVENHVASEREKNKRIDDLSREVGKLKDALNSLSQLSYSSCSPSKRQHQNQHLETLQQQIKQLQYQLAESEKQHQETVSVYRMHLLYAVQGQMDEDVQKALKQILKMCKVPNQAKEAC
ncbi:ankycorbin [Nematolebias whitei]|uniref:ankycorbin n=1 Tax=Nematolebias whitei TaxID=451745 RepID=UPI00189A27E4|nr:ankycorbin [Nematolebias whitei]